METDSFFWYLGVLVAGSLLQTIFTLHILSKIIAGEVPFSVGVFTIGAMGWVLGPEMAKISFEAMAVFGQLVYVGLWFATIILWGISLTMYYTAINWLDEKIRGWRNRRRQVNA